MGRPKTGRRVHAHLQNDIMENVANGGYCNHPISGYTPSSIQTYLYAMQKIYGAKSIPHLVHIWHVENIFNDSSKIKTQITP